MNLIVCGMNWGVDHYLAIWVVFHFFQSAGHRHLVKKCEWFLLIDSTFRCSQIGRRFALHTPFNRTFDGRKVLGPTPQELLHEAQRTHCRTLHDIDGTDYQNVGQSSAGSCSNCDGPTHAKQSGVKFILWHFEYGHSRIPRPLPLHLPVPDENGRRILTTVMSIKMLIDIANVTGKEKNGQSKAREANGKKAFFYLTWLSAAMSSPSFTSVSPWFLKSGAKMRHSMTEESCS